MSKKDFISNLHIFSKIGRFGEEIEDVVIHEERIKGLTETSFNNSRHAPLSLGDKVTMNLEHYDTRYDKNKEVTYQKLTETYIRDAVITKIWEPPYELGSEDVIEGTLVWVTDLHTGESYVGSRKYIRNDIREMDEQDLDQYESYRDKLIMEPDTYRHFRLHRHTGFLGSMGNIGSEPMMFNRVVVGTKVKVAYMDKRSSESALLFPDVLVGYVIGMDSDYLCVQLEGTNEAYWCRGSLVDIPQEDMYRV